MFTIAQDFSELNDSKVNALEVLEINAGALPIKQ